MKTDGLFLILFDRWISTEIVPEIAYLISSQKRNKKVLLIEGDSLISSLVEFRSNKEEDNTGLVNDGNAAIQAINTGCLALAMTEVMVPYKNGIETHHPVRKVIPKVPISVLSF